MDKGKDSPKVFYVPSEFSVETRPNTLYVGHEPPRVMLQPHWHAQVELNFMVNGTVDYRIGRQVFRLLAGSMILFWGGMAHQTLGVSDDADYVCIHLPLTDFFRIRLPVEIQNQLIHGSILISAPEDPSDIFNFVRWADYLRFGGGAMVENALDEVLLRIERSAFGSYELLQPGQDPAIQTASVETATRTNVARMCNFIGENFREEIDAADIAQAAELHPKYAMSVFKKSTGMTFNQYLSLLRLSYAQAHLLDEGVNIIDVAMDSGFGSLSAFYKSFVKLAGKSPTDFRRDSHARPSAVGDRQRVANTH